MQSERADRSERQKSGAGTARKEGASERLAQLSLAALGVVFGDIATSPLYAVRECFYGEYGVAVTRENVLGVLSLMFWSLILIVTVKYLTFVLRADNDGEGGVIALTALIKSGRPDTKSIWSLVPVGVFAACLLYGDGMITPAISVLSAIEGIRIITPQFQEFVLPLTIVILAGLFLLQKRGTARVGKLFGPVILVWLTSLATLGLVQIMSTPAILAALVPWHGLQFLLSNGTSGFLVLGAVFLVVTGAEALYADLGHFGRRPIRLTWVGLVLPALLLNYFGQGALLLTRPEAAYHPFYSLVPDWAVVPMVLLATLATIIASQAVITGAFSLTRQAIRLGYLPRMQIRHTSAAQIGQTYVPPVNWLLMVCTIGLVIGFRSSSQLAAAYGVAVTSTMLVTTVLFCMVARRRWGWSRLQAGLLAGLFLLVDIPFFGANVSKILHGAWFPILIGSFFFVLMLTWERGRKSLLQELRGIVPPFEEFKQAVEANPPKRISGQAIFLTGDPVRVPAALMHNLKHNRILHSEIVFLHFRTENVPRVPNFEKVETQKLGAGFFRITARYGFMEQPSIANTLALAYEQGVHFKAEEVSYFLGRERLSLADPPRMGRFRSNLFVFMSRNAADAATFFDIPSEQIIEIGVQLRL